MQTELKAILPTSRGPQTVTLFGYSTKSVPTVDIHGMGKSGKIIKEKILFVTKQRKLKIPIKRFSISVDFQNGDERELNNYAQWLEFPLLLLYWYLTENLHIYHLGDCMTSGQVLTSGNIIQPFHSLVNKSSGYFENPFIKKHKIIVSEPIDLGLNQIFIKDLFEHIPQIKVLNR